MAALYRAVAPSNIALIKYWGKSDATSQWPANDSLSMTLDHCRTVTTAVRCSSADHQVVLEDQQISRQEQGKIFAHIDRLCRATGHDGAKLDIVSRNTFPAGCGIASSASGFAALTLAVAGALLEAGDLAALAQAGYDREQLADLARLGSGSACRSLTGGFVHWQRGAAADGQKVTTCPGPELADTIVVLSDKPKVVSSSAGHQTAWTSPLFAARIAGLPERLNRMRRALAAGDAETFGPLLEQDALDMHAVMLSSTPALNYFAPETAAFLAWIRRTRQETKLPVWFTMDAGPNVHLISHPGDQERLVGLIRRTYPEYRLISDRTGSGPELSRTD